MPKSDKKKAAPSSTDSDSGPDDRTPVAKAPKKANKSKSSVQKDAKTGDKMPKAGKKRAAPSSTDSDSGPDDRTPVAKAPKKAKTDEKMPKAGKKKAAASDSDSGSDQSPVAKRAKISEESSSGHKDAKAGKPSSGQKDADGNTYFELDEKKRVSIRAYKGTVYVDIREFYSDKAGKLLPGKKGISLQPDIWKKLLAVADDVNNELESK